MTKRELKPFVVADAKYGDKFLRPGNMSESVVTFIGFSLDKQVMRSAIVEDKNGISYVSPSELFLVPICYVQDQPVYFGDRLYHKQIGEFGTVSGKHPDGLLLFLNYSNSGAFLSNLLWEKPAPPPLVKYTRWINIYHSTKMAGRQNIFETQEEADSQGGPNRIACVSFEWEE